MLRAPQPALNLAHAVRRRRLVMSIAKRVALRRLLALGGAVVGVAVVLRGGSQWLTAPGRRRQECQLARFLRLGILHGGRGAGSGAATLRAQGRLRHWLLLRGRRGGGARAKRGGRETALRRGRRRSDEAGPARGRDELGDPGLRVRAAAVISDAGPQVGADVLRGDAALEQAEDFLHDATAPAAAPSPASAAAPRGAQFGRHRPRKRPAPRDQRQRGGERDGKSGSSLNGGRRRELARLDIPAYKTAPRLPNGPETAFNWHQELLKIAPRLLLDGPEIA